MEHNVGNQRESIEGNAAMFTVAISSAGMEAYLRITGQPGAPMPAFKDLIEILKSNNVVFGLKNDAIERLLEAPVFGEDVCIAVGIPPVNGENGRVEFYFDIEKDSKPTILEDGRVDFRELNLIENVRSGQKLCGLIPPTDPEDGMSVLGLPVKGKPGKSAILPRGRNVRISEDGQYAVSVIDGQVSYEDKQINVFACYEVKDDVDNSIGNICFIGNVVIRGNVLSGFTVEAGGTVEVWGVVEAASIKAGGDIILRKGMHGLGKGSLQSGGNIVAKYIESSIVEAKNNITSEAIMHSTVKCGNILELTGRKGLLVGGNCKVGREVRAKVIGSHLATITELETGLDPTIRERYKTVKEEISTAENDIKKAEQAVTILQKLEQAGSLNEEKREMMVKSIRTKIHLSTRLKELKSEMLELDMKLHQDLPGKIKAISFIYPGTRVSIGSCMMYVKETLQYCTLYRDGADVRVGPIDK